MKKSVVLIGVGEMGAVFARGILKLGHPVYPVTRGMDLTEVAKALQDLEAVIVAVGEKDLNGILKTIPQTWRSRLVLLQNELLPNDWKAQSIEFPTVISVWFEKKSGQDVKVILPSVVFGPKSKLIKAALETISIPCRVLNNEDELLFELVLKNVYILTTNIAGLKVGGTVGELWANHRELARQITNEVMDIQFSLIKQTLDRERLIGGMVEAFDKDPNHKCMGRSAPARLERAIALADTAKISVPKLREIYLNKE